MFKSPNKSIDSSKKIYLYEGIDSHGKKTTGEIVALSLSFAKAELRRLGISAPKVKPKIDSIFSKNMKKKITSSEITFFARQMGTLLKAGVPLLQSLDLISKGSENPSMKELVRSLKKSIETGQNFSEALSKYPNHFETLFCNLIYAGESSGSLENMLGRIASYREKTETLKRKIKKALYYPTAVILVAIIVTIILLLFVVPQFQTLFKGFGADLPAFTQFIINLSHFLQKYWWTFLFFIVLSSSVFSFTTKRSPSFRYFLDKSLLKIPIIGSILDKAIIARFSRTLSTTFSSGIPIDQALTSVSGAAGNIIYTKAIMKIKEDVTSGIQLHISMASTHLFPNMVIQMVGIGEESGRLDDMLDKIANIYEEEVDMAVDSLSSLLEPLIMSILGVLVGGLVIAMYLPIFKMGSVI